MSLEDLGNIGELVAAIGVIASLIYLAVQIRQNTRWLRASTHHSVTSLTAEMNRVVEENPEMARILRVGAQDLSQLSPDERIRFNANHATRFRHHEDLYYQHRSGLLDQQQFEGFRRRIAWHLSFPGTVAYWDTGREYHSDRFVAYVDSLIEKALGGSNG